MFELAERLRKLPPYLFAELDEMKAKKESEGVNVIDFGVGDPDLPTPKHVVEAMKKAVEKVENQKYPSYAGKYEFREAVSNFYRRRKGVEVEPDSVIALIGSKEGIAHLPLAFVESGDYVIYTEPGYPVYHSSAIMAGGIPYELPLKEENGFLPDLDSIPDEVARKAKIMFLNYPNNPTTAVAEMDFIKEAVDFCIDNKIILAHDAAYSEIGFDYRPRSFLEYENAFECVIEFGSLSKTYNMTGWRIAYALGNEDAVKGLLKVKTNVDSGVFNAVQEAGMAALNGSDDVIEENNAIYRERRDRLVDGLKELGFKVEKPKATFYVWLRVDMPSMEFAKQLLDKAGVLVTPGVGFGKSGEGYVRFALTRDVAVIDEALRRMEGVDIV
ncbi:LL-diaminopimelate aminotransferase [Geoglobus acetivorans]|uniref:Aminotransferase n=1 Tax=Geoglobus acetivorans TaxID=565033 RepID=A0ABZ3H0B8_GEOAI|nr:LL-diaminopimelate aminotransferase [Geoglobus acetivorans]